MKRMSGIIVLNAELKSTTEIFLFSRWLKAVWSVRAMASLVDLFALYANWCGSRDGRRQPLMCWVTEYSGHFMTTDVKAMGL